MKYPFKVIVGGKVYGEATTLAEAQKVAKAQGGYVARIANPDVLTGKVRQREDGGHYVRTRKDKRPAEVDVTADQVAGDWRTQLAHSGHAPTPKPPKAPKARAPKVAKPKAQQPEAGRPIPEHPRGGTEAFQEFHSLVDSSMRDLAHQMWLELQTKRDAIGFCAALCEDVNFSGPKLPAPDFRDTTPDVSAVAKMLDWDIGAAGALCWSILTMAGATAEANEVRRATIKEIQDSLDAMPQPTPAPTTPQDERIRHKYAAQNGFQVVIDTDTKFEAVGPNGMLKIKAQPGFGNGFIAHLFSSKGRPLEYGSSGFDGTMDEALANLH